MAQVLAGVFTSFHGAPEAILGDGDPDIGWFLGCGTGPVSHTDFKALRIALVGRHAGYRNLGFKAVGGLLDGGLSVLGVVADELGLTVDDHLRRERGFAFEAVDVSLLAEGPIGRGIGVDPAVVIPVVDVFFQGNDLGAVDRLQGFEFAEKSVGWRAGGAAFRGEELDENGSAICFRAWG